ncbi:transglutaminase-like domain-containing protein [Methanoculleus formosensis]|uniref:transglutaminase-like domain-containing protein n=1 Tax=Methanoculleus formosensis TaxID=2590886 RepID=UPI0028F6EAA0|nr:transglutaminase-like domain-containing protein [Methanoculleus sp. Afa-1]
MSRYSSIIYIFLYCIGKILRYTGFLENLRPHCSIGRLRRGGSNPLKRARLCGSLTLIIAPYTMEIICSLQNRFRRMRNIFTQSGTFPPLCDTLRSPPSWLYPSRSSSLQQDAPPQRARSGTQSMLFAAFCRSLGIPARALGGYQMVMAGAPGGHFWAEYYLPGYGWVPNDVTIAEAADWVVIPEEKRTAFKDYYAANLDPARLVIQTNVDIPMDPALPDDDAIFRVVRQSPAIVSDTVDYDIELTCMECFGISLETVA